MPAINMVWCKKLWTLQFSQKEVLCANHTYFSLQQLNFNLILRANLSVQCPTGTAGSTQCEKLSNALGIQVWKEELPSPRDDPEYQTIRTRIKVGDATTNMVRNYKHGNKRKLQNSRRNIGFRYENEKRRDHQQLCTRHDTYKMPSHVRETRSDINFSDE